MIVQLPPVEPDDQQNQYDYTIALGDFSYRVVLTWRERCLGWYLTLSDSDDEILIDGKRLAINWPVLFRHKGRQIVGGQLVLVDTTDPLGGVESTFEDLGHRCVLLWAEDSEITNDRQWWVDFETTTP